MCDLQGKDAGGSYVRAGDHDARGSYYRAGARGDARSSPVEVSASDFFVSIISVCQSGVLSHRPQSHRANVICCQGVDLLAEGVARGEEVGGIDPTLFIPSGVYEGWTEWWCSPL